MRTIGICCIGSGVGQSTIRSLKLSNLPIRTVGFGTNPFAFGAYECDAYDFTPSIYDDGYIDSLIGLCATHKVEMLIPGLDDEALLMSRHLSRFEAAGIRVLCASEDIVSLCRDKERASTELNFIVDVFVRTYSPSDIHIALAARSVSFPLIAKPRSGFASRGVEIVLDEDDLNRVSDQHIIQELAVPRMTDPNHAWYMTQLQKRLNPQVSELSIQLVFGVHGNLLGMMATVNTLNQGIPIEVLPYDDPELWETVNQLIPELQRRGLRGPLNLQGRLTDNGLKIFEMNPRFTGITAVRALMGFNEVEACVKDWLGLGATSPTITANPSKFGMRQTLDMVVPIDRERRVNTRHVEYGSRLQAGTRHLLVTGASGYLGRNLIHALREDDRYRITAFGRNMGKLREALPPQSNLDYCDQSDWSNGRLQFGRYDVLLHLGSARPHHSTAELADSTRFSNEILTQAAMNQVPVIVNLSSQSVYGSVTPPMWTESTPVNPMIPYAMSKYAVEQMMSSLARIHSHLKMVSIRMGSITGGAPGMLDVDVICKMSLRAMSGQPLIVSHPDQMIQRIDIRDAVDGVLTLIQNIDQARSSVYNLTSPELQPVYEVAHHVSKSVALRLKNTAVPVVFAEPRQSRTEVGMSSGRFQEEFNWTARHSLFESIDTVVEMLPNKEPNTKVGNGSGSYPA